MLSRFFVFNFSGGPTMLWHRQGYFLLDGAVVFIEGYPLVAPPALGILAPRPRRSAIIAYRYRQIHWADDPEQGGTKTHPIPRDCGDDARFRRFLIDSVLLQA